jgi:nickel-dependent lactate racemase
MEIAVPYGHTTIKGYFPDFYKVDLIEAPNPPALQNPQKAIKDAIVSPKGNFNWKEYEQVKSVGIAINDKTRPVPHKHLLPPLLDQLAGLGIVDSAITFYIAVGSHVPIQNDELSTLLPDSITNRYSVVSHDSEDEQLLISLGETTRGTPIITNRSFHETQLKIVVGNIEPHQFAGFSGGVKTAAIGLAGIQTINQNHSLLSDPKCKLGEYVSNPIRQDIEEIGEKIGVHFALNAILNQDKQIVHVLAGDPVVVMQTGIPLSRQICQKPVDSSYDLLIVSPGGYPKDINLYQSQKALAHASLIIKPGGTIILAAACPEGTGSQKYEAWMKGMTCFNEVLERFKQEGFRIGPHKAFLIARDGSKINLLFISEMDPIKAQSLLLPTRENLQKAIDSVMYRIDKNSRIGVLPHASSTIPFIGRAIN